MLEAETRSARGVDDRPRGLTPSASGLAQALFGGGGAAGFSGTDAGDLDIVARRERLGRGSGGASRSASGALTVFGAASATRGEEDVEEPDRR